MLFITNYRLGDAVLTTGILNEALQRFAPDHVTIVCGPIAAPLFQGVPHLERISIIDRGRPAQFWFNFWTQSVGRKWDVVIDIRNTLLPFFIAARKVYRYKRSDPKKHKAEQLAGVLGLLSPPPSKIWLTQSAKAKADELMPAGVMILALCPWAGWPPKQWPADQFVATARKILAQIPQFSQAHIAIFGENHDARAQEMISALAGEYPVIDLVGRTDPLEAAACLARCSFALTNDSGLMHLAAAMGTPTLGLFGPSNDVEYRPLGSHSDFVRAVGISPGADPSAFMPALSVEEVFSAAQKLWASVGASEVRTRP